MIPNSVVGRVFVILLSATLMCCASALRAAISYALDPDIPTLNPTHMVRDRAGRVWLAERENLSWFDGHRFQTEQPDDGLGNITDLSIQGDRLLVAHEGGVAVLDLAAWRWQRLATQSALAIESHAGRLYLASDAALGELTLAPTLSLTPLTGQWPERVLDLHSLPSGLYGTSATGYWRYDLEARTAEKLRFNAPALDNGERYAWSMTEWPAGQLWLGFWDDALVRLDLKTGKHDWFHPQQRDTGALRSTSIYDLLPLGDRLIIATNRGLVYFETSCACFKSLNLPRWDAVDGSGVIIDDLASAEQPDQHGLWASVLGEGLARFDRNDFYFSNQVRVESVSGAPRGLSNNMVRALALRQNELYVGSYGGGVQMAQQRPIGQLWAMGEVEYASQRIEARYLWHILPRADGLALSTGDGLVTIDAEGSVALDSIKSARCAVELDGRLWVGTTRGVFRTDGSALVPIGPPAAVLSCARVGDHAWFGQSDGLRRFRGDGTELPPPRGPDLEQSSLIVFAQHHGTTTWLATNQGVLRASPGQDQDWSLDVENAAIDRAMSIAVDGSQRLWLGTSQGLIRYDPGSRRVDRFDAADGLFGREMNIGALLFDGQYMHVGGNGGLATFEPDRIAARSARLTPRIERLRVGTGPWARTSRLSLPAQHAPVYLEFASNDYARPRQLRYSVRLLSESRTGEWVSLGAHPDFMLERLPAGQHRLEVQVLANDVADSAAQATLLHLNVAAMWYQRTSTIMLALLTLLGVGFGFGSWRARWLAVQRATLERKIAEQTTELRARNAELQRLAVTDPLTGLANRRQLFEVLSAAENVAILALDLDHFKRINDTFGHAAGDRILQQFAGLLTSYEPKRLAARTGGEEFVLVLDRNAVDPLKAAQQILTQTRSLPIHLGEKKVSLTVSIGVLPSANGAPDESMRRADDALYRAKQWRDTIVVGIESDSRSAP